MPVRYARAICHIQDRHGPIDVIHTYTYRKARHLPRISKRLGIPYVISEQRAAFSRQSPVKKRTNLSLYSARRAYKHAAFVMPVSDYMREMLEGLGLRANFRVLRNPIDTDRFRVREAPETGPEIRLLSVGRLSPAKGMDVLLRAVADARRHDPRLRLTIAGSGPERKSLEALRSELGLDEVVDFAGQRPPEWIVETLQKCHVFVLASRVEPHGVAIVEAVSSGVPVVATAAGGIPEHVGDVQGAVVPVDDIDAFARAILRTVERLPNYDRAEMAASARDRFSYEAVGAVLEEIYESAAGRRAAGADAAR